MWLQRYQWIYMTIYSSDIPTVSLWWVQVSIARRLGYKRLVMSTFVSFKDGLLGFVSVFLTWLGMTLSQVLVDCSGGEQDEKTPESAFANKRKALLQLVEQRPVAKTIIFCNKVRIWCWKPHLLKKVLFVLWKQHQRDLIYCRVLWRRILLRSERVIFHLRADFLVPGGDVQESGECSLSVWQRWQKDHCATLPCSSDPGNTPWEHGDLSKVPSKGTPVFGMHWQVWAARFLESLICTSTILQFHS